MSRKKKNMHVSEAAHEWQRVHDNLLQKERHLAQLAVRHARGQIATEDLDALKAEVGFLRKLADALFETAFSAR